MDDIVLLKYLKTILQILNKKKQITQNVNCLLNTHMKILSQNLSMATLVLKDKELELTEN